jgi:hypothetical protein
MEEASKHGFELRIDYFKANGLNSNSDQQSHDELNLGCDSKSSGSKSKRRKIHVLSDDEEDGFLADEDSQVPKLIQPNHQ